MKVRLLSQRNGVDFKGSRGHDRRLTVKDTRQAFAKARKQLRNGAFPHEPQYVTVFVREEGSRGVGWYRPRYKVWADRADTLPDLKPVDESKLDSTDELQERRTELIYAAQEVQMNPTHNGDVRLANAAKRFTNAYEEAN